MRTMTMFIDEQHTAFGGGGGGGGGGSSPQSLSSYGGSYGAGGSNVGSFSSTSSSSYSSSSSGSSSSSSSSSMYSLSSGSSSFGLSARGSSSGLTASSSSFASPSSTVGSSSYSLSSGSSWSSASSSSGSGLKAAASTVNNWSNTVSNGLDILKGAAHYDSAKILSAGATAAASTLTRGVAAKLPGRVDYALSLQGRAPINTSSVSSLYGSLSQRAALQTPTGLQNYQLSHFSANAKSSQQIAAAAKAATPAYTAGSWLGRAGAAVTVGAGAFDGYANSLRTGLGRAIDTAAGAVKQADNLAAQGVGGLVGGLSLSWNPVTLPAAPMGIAAGAIGAGTLYQDRSWDKAFNSMIDNAASWLQGKFGTSGTGAQVIAPQSLSATRSTPLSLHSVGWAPQTSVPSVMRR